MELGRDDKFVSQIQNEQKAGPKKNQRSGHRPETGGVCRTDHPTGDHKLIGGEGPLVMKSSRIIGVGLN